MGATVVTYRLECYERSQLNIDYLGLRKDLFECLLKTRIRLAIVRWSDVKLFRRGWLLSME